MPHYSDSQICTANQTDLAEYLTARGEKLKECGEEYLWEARQVWIRGCKWYSHYDSVGGYPISFLMTYFNMDFQRAVGELIGDTAYPIEFPKLKSREKHDGAKAKPSLPLLPPRSPTMTRVFSYLIEKRFISRDVIRAFAHNQLLYEDGEHHNCVFVGVDEKNVPRHIHLRSTSGTYKQNVAGSNSEYAFHYDGYSDLLYVFEAPIDMLAFITAHPDNWTNHSYVALCSVSEKALLHRLEVQPSLCRIFLCLDNDSAGRSAADRIRAVLSEKGYKDVTVLLPKNKDWDEDLKEHNRAEPIPGEEDHTGAVYAKCREIIEEAKKAEMPMLLFEKLKDSFYALTHRPSVVEVQHLTAYLILQIKEEYRKSRIPMEWEDLTEKLLPLYIPYTDNGSEEFRIAQIISDGKNYFSRYDNPHIIRDADFFIAPALKLCMDCIRYLCCIGRNGRK